MDGQCQVGELRRCLVKARVLCVRMVLGSEHQRQRRRGRSQVHHEGHSTHVWRASTGATRRKGRRTSRGSSSAPPSAGDDSGGLLPDSGHASLRVWVQLAPTTRDAPMVWVDALALVRQLVPAAVADRVGMDQQVAPFFGPMHGDLEARVGAVMALLDAKRGAPNPAQPLLDAGSALAQVLGGEHDTLVLGITLFRSAVGASSEGVASIEAVYDPKHQPVVDGGDEDGAGAGGGSGSGGGAGSGSKTIVTIADIKAALAASSDDEGSDNTPQPRRVTRASSRRSRAQASASNGAPAEGSRRRVVTRSQLASQTTATRSRRASTGKRTQRAVAERTRSARARERSTNRRRASASGPRQTRRSTTRRSTTRRDDGAGASSSSRAVRKRRREAKRSSDTDAASSRPRRAYPKRRRRSMVRYEPSFGGGRL